MKSIRRINSLKRTLPVCLLALLAMSMTLTSFLSADTDTEERFGLTFPPISSIELPTITEYKLDNGMTFLLSEDRDFPIIYMNFLIDGGSIHEEPDKIGLADIMTDVFRTGGTKNYSPSELDELLDYMAASISSYSGVHTNRLTMSFLSQDAEEALDILNDLIRNPGFEQESIDRSKLGMNSSISRRNDQISGIAIREFLKLVYGEDSAYARTEEYSTITNIDRDDIVDYHDRFYRPQNVIASVVGDFDTEEMKTLLNQTFGNWQREDLLIPAVDPIEPILEPSVNLIEREDFTQTWIVIGHATEMVQRDPDYIPMLILNDILGASFSGRIFQRIRNQLGLAYAPSSHYSVYFDFPGIFYLLSQTTSNKTITAINALIDEVHRIREEPVTEEELAFAKESYFNSFIFNYDRTDKIVSRQLNYKFWDYPEDFLERVREEVDKVTIADIQRVAQKYLHPDKFVILVAGIAEEFEQPISTLGEVNIIDITIPPPPRKEAPEATPDRIRTGTEIYKRSAQAMGDIEKIDNIKLQGAATNYVQEQSQTINLSIYLDLPDKVAQIISTPGGNVEMIFNKGETALRTPAGKMDLPGEITNELVNQLRSNPVALANSFYQEFEIVYVEDKVIGDKDFHILSFNDETSHFLLFINKETMLPFQSIYEDPQQMKPVYMIFDEYAEIDGIHYPVKIVRKDEEGKVLSEMSYSEVEFNVTIPESVFNTE